MYFPGKTQNNPTLASLQRTFYPKHTTYWGDGTGRDQQTIMNNGGLTPIDKTGLGHQGVHLQRYNRPQGKEVRSRSPAHKDAPTFYYQSDGSGRDSYVLMDNGGYRPEYAKYNKSPQKIFADSLRSDQKSPLKYFKDAVRDKADITSYLNW